MYSACHSVHKTETDEEEKTGQKFQSDKLLRFTSRIRKFDGGNDEGWDVWIQRFELLAGLGDKSEWLEALFICLDGKALDVCASMPEELRRQYAEVKKALSARFGKDVNTIHAYSDLNQAIRQTGESFEDFGDRIQELAKRAYPEKSFSDLQSAIVSKFLCGLKEPWLQTKLMDKPLSTLDEAVKEVRCLRRTRDALAAIGAVGGSSDAEERPSDQVLVAKAPSSADQLEQKVNRLQEKLDEVLGVVAAIGEAQSSKDEMDRQRQRIEARCFGCGEPGHFRRNCPHASPGRQKVTERPEAFCLCCGKAGHWMATCRKRPELSRQSQHLSEN